MTRDPASSQERKGLSLLIGSSTSASEAGNARSPDAISKENALKFTIILAACATLAGPALAQTSAPSSTSGTPTGSSNPAVSTGGNAPASTMSGKIEMVSADKLEKGANSFTEGQVRSRLEAAGLSDVTDLKKDGDGIWRGKAKKGGASVAVGVDYKGNISAG